MINYINVIIQKPVNIHVNIHDNMYMTTLLLHGWYNDCKVMSKKLALTIKYSG
jgi:hypothetical protein